MARLMKVKLRRLPSRKPVERRILTAPPNLTMQAFQFGIVMIAYQVKNLVCYFELLKAAKDRASYINR